MTDVPGAKPEGPPRIGLVDVSACARCYGAHAGIPYAAFTHPPLGPDGRRWPYWAVCPETGEPVMLEVGPRPAGVKGKVEDVAESKTPDDAAPK